MENRNSGRVVGDCQLFSGKYHSESPTPTPFPTIFLLLYLGLQFKPPESRLCIITPALT